MQSYSWTVYSDTVAVKTTDLSVFNNMGSGIPVDIRPFFGIDSFKGGDRRDCTLEFNGTRYSARLERINSTANQTRIMWRSNLSQAFRELYPDATETENYPDLRFEKKSDGEYRISFIESDNQFVDERTLDLETVVETGTWYAEGKRLAYYTTKYERDPKNRREAIRIHGTKCMACGFDFESAFGRLGRGFIEVHHVTPLYSQNEEREINPETDLVCICSNCHRMIHRRKDDILTVDQLKEILADSNARL